MTWQPTTRGTGPSKALCHYKKCRGKNDNTNFYTADSGGTRFFCDLHWQFIGFLFKEIHDCEDCVRNHKADYSKKEATFVAVKYQQKWWNLCDLHYDVYDDFITYMLDIGD